MSSKAKHTTNQTLRCQPEDSLGPCLPRHCTTKTQIRQGRCQDWSESLHILLVLFCSGLVTNSISAASWQNQQNDCAPSEDLDQPGHLPSLVFTMHSMGSKDPSFFHVDSEDSDQTGRTESSLGAHTILLVLSWGGSFSFRLSLECSGIFFLMYVLSNHYSIYEGM